MCGITKNHKGHKFHPKKVANLGPTKVAGKKLPDQKIKTTVWSKI